MATAMVEDSSFKDDQQQWLKIWALKIQDSSFEDYNTDDIIRAYLLNTKIRILSLSLSFLQQYYEN